MFSLEQYRQQGYSGPIQAFTEAEARYGYERFFEVLGQSPANPGPSTQDMSAWHHKYRWAYDLASHPSIVDPISSILGENVILWAMHFWYKEPGNDKYIPWHQDINYWPMEPAINATAWCSLGVSVTDNGCLRVIPGTHREIVQHEDMGDKGSAFGQGIASAHIDEDKAVDLEMTPGQAVFFNESIFHGSNRNTSSIARVAFSVRYTVPEVKFKMEEWEGNRNRIRTFLLRGKDDYHYNDDIIGTVPER